MINIPSYIDDPSYRYKMPSLVLRTEGRLNGVKTKIVNLEDVAKALRIPPTYPLKYMGYELGSQIHEKDMIINGDFKDSELKKLMDKFIEKYVLCPKCSYPEMIVKVKNGIVTGSCNSCGNKNKLDNTHKLAAHIVKNPPKNKSEFKKDDKKPTVEDKKELANEKKGSSKKKSGSKKNKEDSDHKGEESKKEEKQHVQEEKGPEIVVYDFKANEDDLIKKVKEVYDKHAGLENFEGKDEAINEIVECVNQLDLPTQHQQKRSYILFNAIFDLNIAKQIEKNLALLTKSQTDFQVFDKEIDNLLNLEQFMLFKNDNCDKYVGTILKFFNDHELLSDEFLIDWFDGKINHRLMLDSKYDIHLNERFRKLSSDFIDYLKGGDDDDEDDEEEDDLADI